MEASVEIAELAQSVADQFAAATSADVDADECTETLTESALDNHEKYGLNAVEAMRSPASELFASEPDVDSSDYSLHPDADQQSYSDDETPAPAEVPDEAEIQRIKDLEIPEDAEENKYWPDADLVAYVAHLNSNDFANIAQDGLLRDGPFRKQDSVDFRIYAKSAANTDFGLDDYEAVTDYPHDADVDEDTPDEEIPNFYDFVGADREDDPEGVPVRVGECVRIRNYVVEEQNNGTLEVRINGLTTMAKIPEEEAPEPTFSFEGYIGEIKSGSGLITRCPECNRTTDNGRCPKHGAVDDFHDMRIKAVIENGGRSAEVIFNKEMTEELTGMSLDEAKEMAQAKVDKEAPLREIRSGGEIVSDGLLGKRIDIDGSVFDESYIFAEEAEFKTEVPEANSSLVRARELQA